MSNPDPWHDFDQVRHSIKSNTVDKLKQVVAGLNDECGLHLAKSGKKQELIDRIVDVLNLWQRTNNEEKWMKGKAVVSQVRNPASLVFQNSQPNRVQPAIPQPVSVSHNPYDPPKSGMFSISGAGPSNIAHYDPYAPPRRPTAPLPSTSSAGNAKLPIRFKESPFFSIEQAVSHVTECPESTSATDRRVASLTFTLNSEQSNKMKTPGSKYQLRLFCTSSVFYAGYSTFRTNPMPCPVEFPPTCEVRINMTAIQANLKGLKKKPGTAPPPDISSLTRLSGSNKVDMIYVNSQQPVQSKKFFMIVMLVEATTTEALVSKLKSQQYRSADQILQKMRQCMIEDDDIVAGPQKMSLRCPLTFVRISTPCRSEKCVHPQCFDATSWFTMMEQTTTWLCPVCERVLDHKDLIVDGYFDEILQQTPDTVEDVMVEADGEWHTADNEYASAQWKATHPPKVSSPVMPEPPQLRPSQPAVNGTGQVNGNDKATDVEILVLDSDEDEDEGRVKRELSPSYTSSRASFDAHSQTQTQTQTQSNKTVIDLTLDDTDDEQPPVSNSFGKRKASDANLTESLPEQLWKKGRIDSSRILPAPRPSAPLNTGLRPTLNNHPPSPPNLLYPSFPNNTLPPVWNVNTSLQLPPIPPSFVSRPPTSSHNTAWP